MAKLFRELRKTDKVYLTDMQGNLLKELTVKFQGNNSINFVEDDSCIFNRNSFNNKTEIEVKVQGKHCRLKTNI